MLMMIKSSPNNYTAVFYWDRFLSLLSLFQTTNNNLKGDNMAWELQSHMHQHLQSTIRAFIGERCKCVNEDATIKQSIDLLITVCSSHIWEEGECFASIKESIKNAQLPRFYFMATVESPRDYHQQWIIEQLSRIVGENAIETATTDNGGHRVYLDRHGDWTASWFIDEPFDF